MAQFDVHRFEGGLVIDCQSDLLGHIASRLVVPLVPRTAAPPPVGKLNPIFGIEGDQYVMVTQSAAAVQARKLGPVVTSFADQSLEIIGAVDVLIGGV